MQDELSKWKEIEQQIFQQSQQAILRFSSKYENVECTYIAFGIDAEEGVFTINFDSLQNSIKLAQTEQNTILENRKKMLNISFDYSWKNAFAYLGTNVVSYGSEAAFFIHHELLYSHGENWRQYFEDKPIHPGHAGGFDYLTANSVITVWRVIVRLLEAKAFETLNLASPCYIGYQLPEEPVITVHVLWKQD